MQWCLPKNINKCSDQKFRKTACTLIVKYHGFGILLTIFKTHDLEFVKGTQLGLCGLQSRSSNLKSKTEKQRKRSKKFHLMPMGPNPKTPQVSNFQPNKTVKLKHHMFEKW